MILVRFIMCCGLYIFVQSFTPKALASERTSGVENYMIDEQRTRGRPHYQEELGLENEILENIDNVGPPYEANLAETEISKEDLSAFIVGYANIIPNKNSVETRNTKNRVKNIVEKRNPASGPCNCEYDNILIDLGEEYYPRLIENKVCNDQMCSNFNKCHSKVYQLTVLKRRRNTKESQLKVPIDLRHQWVAEKKPVTVGCMCTKEYMIH